MACDPVPQQLTGQQILVQPLYASPYAASWWTAQTIENIPPETVGWLVAQGWQITDVTLDTTTTPATPSYDMARQSLQNWNILQSLLDSYTEANNLALTNNTVRYNDILASWANMLDTSHTQFESQSETHEAHAALFLSNLASYMDEVDTLITDNQNQLSLDAGTAKIALDEVEDRLLDIEANVAAKNITMEQMLTSEGVDLNTFTAAVQDRLDDLDTNYAAHLTTLTALLTDGDTDLATFAATQAPHLTAMSEDYTDFVAELDSLLTTAAADVSGIAATIDAILASLLADYTTLSTDIDAQLTLGTSALGDFATDYEATLALLTGDYTTIATALDAERTSANSALSTYKTDHGATVDLLDTDYTTIATALNAERTSANSALTDHKVEYSGELDALSTDHSGHAVTATAFLDSLGVTELARINETFDASLATQLQQLTDRGLYSSAMAAGITERNTRDRNEEIVALNDRLNREKWENDHRLYEQKVAMRARTLEGTDRLHGVEQEVLRNNVAQLTSRFGLQQSARDRKMAGIDREHGAEQEVLRNNVAQLTSRFGLQQSVRDRTMSGTDRVNAVKQEVYRYQAAAITGVYQSLVGVRDRTLAGEQALYAIRDANTRRNTEIQTQLYESTQALKTRLIEEAGRLQQLEQSITQWKTTERVRLLEQVQQIETQHIAGLERKHVAFQTVWNYAIEHRDLFLKLNNDASREIAASRERYAAATLQRTSMLAEHKHRAVVEKMNESDQRLSGLQQQHDACMRLMEYQLDKRNEILVGLYGFVERRDDVPPSFEALATLAVGLGDSGGGWVSP